MNVLNYPNRWDDEDDCMTPEQEAEAWLDECLERVRWPIWEEGYEFALDEQSQLEIAA